MLIRRIAWLTCGFLALAALTLGYQAITTSKSVVTVEWATATELNTAGFNLYRSENHEGPFTRINDQLIPSAPDPLVGGTYVFTDTTVQAGRIYYYQLEDIEYTGGTNRHGPIEVKAERSGGTDLLLAFALAAAALLGLALLTTTKR